MQCHVFWSQVEYKIVCFIYYCVVQVTSVGVCWWLAVGNRDDTLARMQWWEKRAAKGAHSGVAIVN